MLFLIVVVVNLKFNCMLLFFLIKIVEEQLLDGGEFQV